MRLLEELLNSRHGGVEHVGDIFRPFIFIRAAFGDFKDPGFGEVEQIFAGAALGIETGFGDFIRHRNHLAYHRALADDIGISADVRRAWRIFR